MPLLWALPAAIAIGMAKTGVPGLGVLVVPVFAMLCAGDVAASAAALLPLLLVADVVAVALYRKHAEARQLFALAPWVLLGMAGGFVALRLGNGTPALRCTVGAIVLAMVVMQIWRRLRPTDPAPSTARAVAYGATAGFATTVANAAGAVMNLYLLAQRLPKEAFIATGAWFFLLVNAAKVPLYAANGQFSRTWLLLDLALVPAVLFGCWCGRRIAHRLPQRLFELIVLVFAAVGGAWLLVG